jgi:hypothetical protein
MATSKRSLAIDDPRHGTRYAYCYYRCRCDDCTRANRQDYKRQSDDRAKRVTEKREHGKWTTYSNWQCRCDECKEAARIRNAEAYARRKGVA